MLTTITTLSDRDFKRIGQVVYQHCGINLHDGKRELVQARLVKLLRGSHFKDVSEYLDEVLNAPESPQFADLIDSLSTNLTSFFREVEHFDYLAQHYLPRLIEKKSHMAGRRIRAWSAASSTGEEPYSIAMTVKHALETAGSHCEAAILATDISHRVLRTAKEGVYAKLRVGPVPPALKSKYLVNSAKAQCVEVTGEIRGMVHFAHLNLMESWPFSGPLDFVFCRNVMIYFDKPTQQKLIERFWDILDSGGLLFTGHSESLTGISHRFRYVQPTIYLKP